MQMLVLYRPGVQEVIKGKPTMKPLTQEQADKYMMDMVKYYTKYPKKLTYLFNSINIELRNMYNKIIFTKRLLWILIYANFMYFIFIR